MADFLQKHKKKGILAAVLLFLKRGRGLWAFLAMLVLLLAVFVGPTKTGNGLWLQMVAERMGMQSMLGFKAKAGAAGELEQALDTARTRPTLMRISDTIGSGESIGLIVGGKDLLDKGTRMNIAAGVVKKGGKTVGGILNPEDAAKADVGVSVDEDELRSGLANAYAGEVAGGGPPLGAGTGIPDGAGAPGGGYVSASNSGLDMVKNTMGDQGVPIVGNGSFHGTAHGGVGWNKMQSLHAKLGQAAGMQNGGKSSVMYQLAQGRAYSIAAAPSKDGMGHCDPGPCPAEFASNTGGAVFDGGKSGGQLLTATALGEAPSPVTPDSTVTTPLVDEASKLEADMRKCEEAENTYGPDERKQMAIIQNGSDALVAHRCNSGGCTQKLADQCKQIAQNTGMKAACIKYNDDAKLIAAPAGCNDPNPPLMRCETYDQ
jgi:hypothetical protein